MTIKRPSSVKNNPSSPFVSSEVPLRTGSLESLEPMSVVPEGEIRVHSQTELLDSESQASLQRMSESQKVAPFALAEVKVVLVVLSAKGMIYDMESLRQKILLAYPEAIVFFESSLGRPMRSAPPERIDLVIDLTAPGQREKFLLPYGLRRRASVVVGRKAGWFRQRFYDRVFDEQAHAAHLPQELLKREAVIQKKVLQLAGVALVASGEPGLDLSKSIALDLPGFQRLS